MIRPRPGIGIGQNLSANIAGDVIEQVSAGRDITGSIGASVSIGAITAGRAILGDITSGGNIGTILAGANESGSLFGDTAAGTIGGLSITAGGSIGIIAAYAAIGYQGVISGTTIIADGGDINTIRAASGINASIWAYTAIGTIDPGDGDLAGSVTAVTGSLGNITVPDGSLTANLTAGGTIGNLTAKGSISGTITAGGNVGNVTANGGGIGSITSEGGDIGTLTAAGNIAGTITAKTGSISDISAGGNFLGNVSAHGSIGNILVAGSLSGYLATTLGTIGADAGIFVGGDINNYIAAGSGLVDVLTFGSVTGSISGTSDIILVASGAVSGDIVTEFGNVDVTAGGNITSSQIKGTNDVNIAGLGNIKTDGTSSAGSVTEEATGIINSTVSARTDAQLTAKMIQGSNVTADLAAFSAVTINASTLTGNLEASATADSINGLTEDGSLMVAPVCFAAGTKILFPDGTGRLIEKLEAGQGVWTIPDNDPNAQPRIRRILQVFHKQPSRIWEVRIAGQVIRATELHPFYVRGKGWVRVSSLACGDELRTQYGQFIKVDGITDTGRSEPVFNLEVEEDHTYFVMLPESQQAVWVHNDDCGGAAPSGAAASTGNGLPHFEPLGPPAPPPSKEELDRQLIAQSEAARLRSSQQIDWSIYQAAYQITAQAGALSQGNVNLVFKQLRENYYKEVDAEIFAPVVAQLQQQKKLEAAQQQAQYQAYLNWKAQDEASEKVFGSSGGFASVNQAWETGKSLDQQITQLKALYGSSPTPEQQAHLDFLLQQKNEADLVLSDFRMGAQLKLDAEAGAAQFGLMATLSEAPFPISGETAQGAPLVPFIPGIRSGSPPTIAIPDGVVYLRTDAAGGLKPYVGQSESLQRYLARQAEHARAFPDADFDFRVLQRADPGTALDVAEESWIRQLGGHTNKSNPNGFLSNKRYQMIDVRYRANGGIISRP